MQEKTKNDGLMSFLTTVLKKSAELPEDVSLLAGSVKILSDKLLSVTNTLSLLAATIQEHSIAINELYAIQSVMLQQMKTQNTGVDSKLPDLNKAKSEKPN